MKTFLKIWFVVMMAFIFARIVFAAGGAGTAGAVILKQDFNPRAEGMGEAFTAVADDAHAMYWNPSGLAYLLGDEATMSFSKGLVDDAFGQISYAHAYRPDLTFAAGLLTYNGGSFDNIDEAGNTTRLNAQTDYMLNLSGAYNLNEEFTAGATFEVLHSTLVETYSGMTTAVTLGGSYIPEKFPAARVGAVIKHLGFPLRYSNSSAGDPLPLNAQIGGAYQLLKSPVAQPMHDLIVALDVNQGWDTPFYVNLGAEYWFQKMFAARLGYKINREVEGLALGLGLKYPALKDMPMGLDYSFSLNTEFNSVHKLALSLFLPNNPARVTHDELLARKKAAQEAAKLKLLEEEKRRKEAEAAAARQRELEAKRKEEEAKQKELEQKLPPITLQVLEIERQNGEAKTLILNAGSSTRGVGRGVIGVIYNPGHVMAGKCRISEVYPSRATAVITDSNAEILPAAAVEIVR